MQRYGPPPSYPNLKIPGLNAPIPQGCSFGYHAGGWGKPPVDETGKPLYGDVFGTTAETKTVSVFTELFLFFLLDYKYFQVYFFKVKFLDPILQKTSLFTCPKICQRERDLVFEVFTPVYS